MIFPRLLTAQFSQLCTARVSVLSLYFGISVSSFAAQEISSFYIREYRIEGARRLKNLEIEEAVYPFLGPARTADDVEQARTAVEKVYHDKGFETLSVSIPSQDPRLGVIRLAVIEGKVGRLRVNGARFFLPSKIKSEIPSLAEGNVPNMNRVKQEIIGLNRLADRKVTPVLRQGIEPGTVDIDLNVEDKSPLHGSLELNNRYSSNTTSLRLNGAISESNLFQKGHSGGLSFQLAPENTDDALVFSGYYLARVSNGTSLMVQATKQNSNVSTLGGGAVGGRGEIVGLRSLFELPINTKFYQNFSLGIDYKNFAEDIVIGKNTISSPIEYYPISANYGANWIEKNGFTEFNASLNFGLRGMGSDTIDYANKRYNADASFVYIRSDLAHTHDLTSGLQAVGKIQGQLSSQALLNSEQISGGGLDTVRGYLEATVMGDNGIFGTLELRSPSLIGKASPEDNKSDQWRFYAFADAGMVGIYDPLPSQQRRFSLASVGAGTRFKVLNHYNGALDVAVPLVDQADTNPGEVRLNFRGWSEF